MEQYRAKGKVAVIFGASGRIGPGVVKKFYQEGASVAIQYRSSKKEAEKLVRAANNYYRNNELKAKAISFQADVTDRKSISNARKTILKELGGYYYLLLFQDFSIDPRLWNLGDPKYRDTNYVEKTKYSPYKIAYVGSINAIEEFSSHLIKKREGSILIVGSSAVFDYYKYGEWYTAAKTALALRLPEYAIKLGKYGVRINGGAWGWVPKGTEDPNEMKRESKDILLWRHGIDKPEAKMLTPELIGEAAFAMANLEGVHGQYILADGGQAVKNKPVPWEPDDKNIKFLRIKGLQKKFPVKSKLLAKTI